MRPARSTADVHIPARTDVDGESMGVSEEAAAVGARHARGGLRACRLASSSSVAGVVIEAGGACSGVPASGYSCSVSCICCCGC